MKISFCYSPLCMKFFPDYIYFSFITIYFLNFPLLENNRKLKSWLCTPILIFHRESSPILPGRNLFILTEGARFSGHMITAYVLIATTMGEEKSVAEKLAKMKEVEVADILYGEWDIILRVKVENLSELDSFLTRTVRKMKNIKLTSTLIAS